MEKYTDRGGIDNVTMGRDDMIDHAVQHSYVLMSGSCPLNSLEVRSSLLIVLFPSSTKVDWRYQNRTFPYDQIEIA